MKNEKHTARHWSRNLPEVGKFITYRAERQENILLTIERMKDEIQKLKNDYKFNEREILQLVEKDWTSEEIQSAILNAIEN